MLYSHAIRMIAVIDGIPILKRRMAIYHFVLFILCSITLINENIPYMPK